MNATSPWLWNANLLLNEPALSPFYMQETNRYSFNLFNLEDSIWVIYEGTSNRLVDIEDMTETELNHLHKFYVQLPAPAEKESDLTRTHSIDAAAENQQRKSQRYQKK